MSDTLRVKNIDNTILIIAECKDFSKIKEISFKGSRQKSASVIKFEEFYKAPKTLSEIINMTLKGEFSNTKKKINTHNFSDIYCYEKDKDQYLIVFSYSSNSATPSTTDIQINGIKNIKGIECAKFCCGSRCEYYNEGEKKCVKVFLCSEEEIGKYFKTYGQYYKKHFDVMEEDGKPDGILNRHKYVIKYLKNI